MLPPEILKLYVRLALLYNRANGDNNMKILLMAHSGLRWIILLVAIIAIVKFALGWLRGGQFKGMDRGLTAGFSGLMDLQVTLGIIYLLWNGFAAAGFPPKRIEHAVIMIIAAVVAHLPARWKNADDKTRFRNNLFVIIGALVLVLVGIASLPGGLSR
jgi:uncharacterized membrane protein YfhO